jgi:hypothetical protein
MKLHRGIAPWLIFGPVVVFILLPILNVLFHIEEAMHPVLPPLILFTGLAMMFAGAFLFFIGGLGIEKERRRILEAGLPAEALVHGMKLGDTKVTYGAVDERWLAELELEVQPETGPSFRAKVQHLVPVLEIPRFQAGEVVEVRYEPGDRSKVAIV